MKKQWKQQLNEYWRERGGKVGVGFSTREEVVAHCLIRWAENIDLLRCPDEGDCEACNIDFGIWWDWMASLSRDSSVAVQNIMRRCGIPFPPGPWEEVPTNDLPTALN